MSDVTIELRIGEIGIAFAGRQAFFEEHVEPLLGAAWAAAPTAASAAASAAADEPTSETRGNDHPTAERTNRGGQAPRGEQAEPAPQPAADPSSSSSGEHAVARFVPASPERFHQFVAQVGDRAAGADKRVMAFAFYLWNYEKVDTFGSDEVAAFFRTTLEEPPEDLPHLLGDVLTDQRGFLERAGEDRWRLREKGITLVKSRLLGQL